MNRAKIKWNIKAFHEVRNSAPVQKAIHKECQRIANAAAKEYASGIGSISKDGRTKLYPGEGEYLWDARPGKTRYHGIVFTDDFRTNANEYRGNFMLKAVGS